MYRIELQHRDVFSNVLMGYNETDDIASTIGLKTTNKPGWKRQAVEMPFPDWYQQYSNSILNDSESRAAWREVISCIYQAFQDEPSCIQEHANEKVIKRMT